MKNEYKRYTIKEQKRKEDWIMNMNDKKVRRIIAIVVMVIIVAMIATSVLPAMMA